jgi:ABC-type protease/lipase transport system fused ATPase/permease subunit
MHVVSHYCLLLKRSRPSSGARWNIGSTIVAASALDGLIHFYRINPEDMASTTARKPFHRFEKHPNTMTGAKMTPGNSLVWQNLRVSGRNRSSRLPQVEILKGLGGVLVGGEILLVIGKPGSGCTTFLKALVGQLDGLEVSDGSSITYRGL